MMKTAVIQQQFFFAIFYMKQKMNKKWQVKRVFIGLYPLQY